MPTPTIEYRTEDKADWGRGAWQGEPDKRQWTDEATGLPCLIVRGPMGALCGYVGVSTDHPAHGKNYDHWSLDDDGERVPLAPVEAAINAIEVHGGLTFAEGCGHGDAPARGICHIPGEGEPDTVWWFGFDCAHYGDACPASRSGLLSQGIYRDQPYVEAQVAALAGQLARITVAAQ